MTRKPQANPEQYVLPFEAAKNELLAQIRLLRSACLDMTHARQEGIVQVLERLALLGNDCREDESSVVHVRAQVAAVAARISARSTTSERTIQRWTRDAIELGVLSVDYCSHQYGRREWNRYRIHVDAIRAVAAGERSPIVPENSDLGVTRGDTVSGPRGDTVSGPGGDTVSPPYKRSTQEKHTTPQEKRAATQPPQPVADVATRRRVSVGAVVSVFLRLGVGRASTLVAQALSRGCDTRSLMAIARWYQRSQRQHPRRWQKPSTVLMIRLSEAMPEVPAWLGWTPGTPPPKRHTPRHIAGPDFRAARAAAREQYAAAGSVADEFRQLAGR